MRKKQKTFITIPCGTHWLFIWVSVFWLFGLWKGLVIILIIGFINGLIKDKNES